ncbi:hypothetical protein QMK33_03585 [Hymenobacter sp. H14-R3]|uniref:hypothetical protein n=1 Tax=Hymenobacter sp. H14-R3 TaxID=3046308 RepID=UPI0024B960BC|nr:hypothetical protein [Hymenobacter sp. H14-R3]MDJ0364219.1 hypothetical protein [Hymenobacter sp. H14-R3]
MGNYTYLIIRTETEQKELLEAKNFLPFFWLTLLDEPALARAEPTWNYAFYVWLNGDEYERETLDDIWPRLTNIHLHKPELLANSAKAQRWLQHYHPALAAAYQDFVRYLLAHLPAEDDHIHLDIYSLAGMQGAEGLLASLREQLTAIDQLHPGPLGSLPPDLLALTGFASLPPAVGEAYPALRQLRAAPPPPARPPTPPAKGSPRTAWWAALIGLMLLYTSYRGYHKEGLSWLVASVALAGGAALVAGIFLARLKKVS